MKILSIETSCDETAVSLVDATGGVEQPTFTVLGNALFSQIDMHKEYGGVYPNVARREHAKNLPILLSQMLSEAGEKIDARQTYDETSWEKAWEILVKELGLFEH